MPDPIPLAALERRNRAAARAKAVWDGAIAMFRDTDAPMEHCLRAAEVMYDALLARCIAAEPPTDETEFAYRGEPMKPE